MGRKRSIAQEKHPVRSEKSSLLGRRPNAAELKDATWMVDQRRVDTFEGPVKFAAVVDKYSGYVLGWSVNGGVGTKSVREALRLAFRKRGECVSPKIHTDNGREFSDSQWKALLRDLNLNQVMSPSYQSTDKADIERFFGKLNAEMFGLPWQPSLQDPNVPRVARAEHVRAALQHFKLDSPWGLSRQGLQNSSFCTTTIAARAATKEVDRWIPTIAMLNASLPPEEF